jgi:predicted lipoprotein with Yx(FWY)xxD motif
MCAFDSNPGHTSPLPNEKESPVRLFVTHRALAFAVAIAALLPATAYPASSSSSVSSAKPAIEIKAKGLGKVIATPAKLGIYYWNVEKKAGGKIRCTGSCAVEWPPVFVKGAVPKHVKGVMATFGTIKRAGKLQLTVNGLPAYTYHRDTANVVLCDNVDGWFVARP